MEPTTDAIVINNLSVNYENTPVLWDVSCSLPQKEIIGIIGPNGAGKSTLLKSILGLVKPLSGSISILGKPQATALRHIAYIPQRESVDWDFPITVEELVLQGCYRRIGLFRRPRKKDKEAAYEMLKLMGLESLSHRQISQLSGGQQQRAFLARALLQKADIYLLDEPFCGVDISTEKIIFATLKELKEKGKTIFGGRGRCSSSSCGSAWRHS